MSSLLVAIMLSVICAAARRSRLPSLMPMYVITASIVAIEGPRVSNWVSRWVVLATSRVR